MTKEKRSDLINRPDKWTANTEIDFGGGLYGYRKTGTVTAAADAETYITMQTGVTGNLIACGGTWEQASDKNRFFVVARSDASGQYMRQSFFYISANNILSWSSICWQARNNSPYDIWALYTKA